MLTERVLNSGFTKKSANYRLAVILDDFGICDEEIAKKINKRIITHYQALLIVLAILKRFEGNKDSVC